MSTLDLEHLIEKLRSNKQSIGFAESCTGGLLSATLCAVPGVSDIFLGSVVSYSNQAKVDLLGVSWNTLKKEGAVSDSVALEMARGVKSRLNSTWSLSVTGVAGPTGGSPDKPVGLVWFAIVGPQIEVSQKMIFSGHRTEIQRQAADYAVKLLLKLLNK